MTKSIISLFFVFLVFAKPSYCQRIIDDGLSVFWVKMKELEKKESLSSKSWNELWNSPGFNKWMDTERSQRIFKNYFELTYIPSYQDSLEKELSSSSGYRTTIFKHLIEVKRERKKIKKFVKRLRSLNLVSKAKKIVVNYLPEDFAVKNDSTQIIFMIFQPDAFAYENVILMDALFAYNYGDGLEYLLAHELHHVYVSFISKLKDIEQKSPYYTLVKSLDYLRMEGTADLIDKSDIIDRPDKDDYEIKYSNLYRESKSHLHNIDSLLQLVSKDESLVEDYGKKIRKELPYNGHPMGLYIAHIIEEHRGRKGILKCLDNPFTFLKMYNDIAKNYPEKYYVFSNSAMQYLEKLESEFILN